MSIKKVSILMQGLHLASWRIKKELLNLGRIFYLIFLYPKLD